MSSLNSIAFYWTDNKCVTLPSTMFRYLFVLVIIKLCRKVIKMLDTLNLETSLFSSLQIYEIQQAIINFFGKDDVKHHLIKKDKKSNQNQKVWSTSGFYPQGILELSVKHKYYPNQITINAKYKPALVTKKKHDQTSLSAMTDYQSAVDGFNYFIDILNAELNSFQLPPVIYWDIVRADYAFQYFTPHYELLLYMLNKGFAMADNLGFTTSAYYVNTCRNINIYDKTLQQKLPAIDGEHLIRFEVQCKRKALEHMAEKYHWERLSIYHVWDDMIAKKTVINAVKLLIGKT